jgi:hypothetical protein
MKRKVNIRINKITKTSSWILLLAQVIFSSCNKQPAADFKTDKTEYIAGDVVKLTNSSIDAKSYKWTMPDGQTSASANLDYTLASNLSDGTLTFKLEAISKKGNKTSEATKLVTVKAANGQVVFWQAPSCGCGITNVTILGITKQITLDYSSIPSCGDNGTATFTLKVGTYSYTATDGTKTWNGNVTVSKNGCFKLQFT